jgi:type I restriction enzyme S subunit
VGGYFGGAIPWFSSGDLESLYLTESTETITEAALVETSAKPVAAGSLLLGMYDTAALKSGIAAVDCSCNQAVAFAQLDGARVSTRYVYSAIQIGKAHFKRNQRGIRQKNLNLSMVRAIEIPLPSRNEQARYESHLESIDQARLCAERSKAELDTLFASLQQRAFAGEL